MAFIPENIIDEIQDKIDIVEVISGYIPLKRAGRNFKANCPFHHEKTPSFMVNPDKQIFHCFGCGEGGNVFSFIMKHERMEFPEVVKMLAEKTGVAIPADTGKLREKTSLTELIHKVNSLSADFFHNNLINDKAAFNYLNKRGIDLKTIKEFRLGYALNEWDGLLNFLKGKGFKENIIKEAGLVVSKDGKSYYDRFRHRLIFPVFDIKNNIIGFGGRVIDGSQEPKYLNSPETAVYFKGRHLYGLNLTKSHIRDEDCAILVEGYLDLISPYQFEIRNIIASCGTALTVDHIRLIRRYTENIAVVYDSDKAGEVATLRSLDILISEGINVKIVRLPEGCDPDSFVHKFGREPFLDALKNSKGLFDYKLGLLTLRYDKSKSEDKVKIINEMLPTISKISNEVLKSDYVKKLAERLSVDENALYMEMKKQKRGYEISYDADFTGKEKLSATSAEKILLGLMIDEARYLVIVKENLSVDDFQSDKIKRVVDRLYKIEYKNLKANKLISYFEEPDMASIISEVAANIGTFSDKDKCLTDCIKWLKVNSKKRELEKLRSEISDAQSLGNDEAVIELVTKYNTLIKNKI